MNLKDIHIGQKIEIAVTERGIEMSRICNFINATKVDVLKMYQSKSLDSEVLLRWSKLLEYDFFRLYSQHLILYAPVAKVNKVHEKETKVASSLPQFRKNIYTQEIIDFILEQINSDQMTIKQVIERYNIPRATLYRWIKKHKK